MTYVVGSGWDSSWGADEESKSDGVVNGVTDVWVSAGDFPNEPSGEPPLDNYDAHSREVPFRSAGSRLLENFLSPNTT